MHYVEAIGRRGKLAVNTKNVIGMDDKNVSKNLTDVLLSKDSIIRLRNEFSDDRQRHLHRELFTTTEQLPNRYEVGKFNKPSSETGSNFESLLNTLNDRVEMDCTNKLPHSAQATSGLRLLEGLVNKEGTDPVKLQSSVLSQGVLNVSRLHDSDNLPSSDQTVIGFNTDNGQTGNKDELPNSTPTKQSSKTIPQNKHQRTPKRYNSASLRKRKLLTNEKLEKTPELLKLFSKMKMKKDEKGLLSRKLDEETDGCPKLAQKSPKFSQVKLLKCKYKNEIEVKRLPDNGPKRVKNEKELTRPSSIKKKNKGGWKKRGQDVQKVDPNQPKLSEVWKMRRNGAEGT